MRSLLSALFGGLVVIQYVHSQLVKGGDTCNEYQKVLDGVYYKQDFGESNRKTIVASSDCQAACVAETTFQCVAFVWASPNGDCILLDYVTQNTDVFLTNSRYKLYLPACDGPTEMPSINYCQYEVTKSNVAVSNGIIPGYFSSSGCEDLCVAQYLNTPCTAFSVSPGNALFSQCMLYKNVASSDVKDGSMDLWTIVCHPASQ